MNLLTVNAYILALCGIALIFVPPISLGWIAVGITDLAFAGLFLYQGLKK